MKSLSVLLRSLDCILVAHNAEFDSRILATEFKHLGYDFHINTLCTVELSRELIPNEKSYSLGKLCRSLGIPMLIVTELLGMRLLQYNYLNYFCERSQQINYSTNH